MSKPRKWYVRPAKTQISLGIRPVWSVFDVHMKRAWVLSYPLSTQWRLWSDWAHRSFCWLCHEAAHISFSGFIRFDFTEIGNQKGPAHNIMALFVFHKLVLQMRMHSHPAGLDVWILVGPFVYCHKSFVRTAMALARLCGCAGSPKLLLVAYVIRRMTSTIIPCCGPLL